MTSKNFEVFADMAFNRTHTFESMEEKPLNLDRKTCREPGSKHRQNVSGKMFTLVQLRSGA
jgi:hypothetical protein